MNMFERFKELNINHGCLGIQQAEHYERYDCTPKDAAIIGSAGVDGIHYCTIPEFEEMIFAVSPMNVGDCVHPIARNFRDLLRLLLACADMAALEQCYAWDEEQFKAFLMDCPATVEQQEALEAIRQAFELEPLEDAFAYVKKLQGEFDLSKIPYTGDYYDVDMNPAAPETETEWRVTYEGGFWSSDGKPGREVPIGKTFYWGSEKWFIPAAYLCDEGLVIDYFMEADPKEVKNFIDKWDLLNESRSRYTREQQEQIQREHPLNTRFYGKVTCNWQLLENGHGCGLTWLPEFCLDGAAGQNKTAKPILEHYGLDENRAWAIRRWSYLWNGVDGENLYALSVLMERQHENIAGTHFTTPAAGESITLVHPLTGEKYILTVHELEHQVLPERLFPDPNMEYPNHLLAMSYSLEPDITGRGFMIQDCGEGDAPRRKKQGTAADEAQAVSFGVIGGADGPTAVIMGTGTPKLHAACSSLRFEAVKDVEWRAVFSEKLCKDISVQLI